MFSVNRDNFVSFFPIRMLPPLSLHVLFPLAFFFPSFWGSQCCIFVTGPMGPWNSVPFYLLFSRFLCFSRLRTYFYCSIFKFTNSFLGPLHSVVKHQSVDFGNCIYQFLNFYLYLLYIFFFFKDFFKKLRERA